MEFRFIISGSQVYVHLGDLSDWVASCAHENPGQTPFYDLLACTLLVFQDRLLETAKHGSAVDNGH